MNLYQFKSFLTLSRLLHFGKAGKACNLSPSALSRQIKAMEDELGVVLFERDNRTVLLTDAGRVFAAYVDDVLKSWEIVKGKLNSMTDVLNGQIRIYCSVTAAYSILPSILKRFRNSYPHIQLQIETGDAAEAIDKVINDQADLAVAANTGNLSSDLKFHSITASPLVFIESIEVSGFENRLTEGNGAWNEIPVVLARSGTARNRFDDWAKINHFTPLIAAEVSGNEAILALVASGLGIGLVPRIVLEKSMLKSQLRIVQTGPDMGIYDIGLCTKVSTAEDPVLQAFWASALSVEL